MDQVAPKDLVFGNVRLMFANKYVRLKNIQAKMRSMGVSRAVPVLAPYTYHLDETHKLIYLGLDTRHDGNRFSQVLRIKAGRLPKKNNEIAISRTFATENRLSIGSSMSVPRFNKATSKRIVGLIEDGYSETDPGYAIFTLTGLQRDFNLIGLINRIEIYGNYKNTKKLEIVTGGKAFRSRLTILGLKPTVGQRFL